jgi:competence protein ComEA
MRAIRALFFVCACLIASIPAFAGEVVDINHADATEIAAAMKGIGLNKAQAIVAYRKEHGPFKSVDDLTMVKGVGGKTVEKNRENLRVGKLEAMK